MFLKNFQTEIFRGTTESVGVLLDMNELFEDFVFRVLCNNKDKLLLKTVAFQKGRRLVRGVRKIGQASFDRKMMFDTYQDIVVEFKSGKKLIIDTKYKILNTKGHHFGIVQSDVYQVLAYRELHTGQTESAVLLIYPEGPEALRQEFLINSENNVRFAAATINLKTDLRENLADTVNQFRELFTGLQLYT